MRIGMLMSEAARRSLLAAPALVLAVGTASAQTPDLVTDRPDQTESAAAVPRGLVQVETGYLLSREDGMDTFEAPGTLVRIGLGARTEVRIGHAGVIGGAGRHGAGDSEVGAKVNLIAASDGWRPELAILGGLSLPTGDEPYSSGGGGSVVPGGVRARVVAAAVGRLQPRRRLGVVTRPTGPGGFTAVHAGARHRHHRSAWCVRRGIRRPADGCRRRGGRLDRRRIDVPADPHDADRSVRREGGSAARPPTPSSAPASASRLPR